MTSLSAVSCNQSLVMGWSIGFISFDDLQVCHGTGSQMSSEGVYEKFIADIEHLDTFIDMVSTDYLAQINTVIRSGRENPKTFQRLCEGIPT